MNSRVDRLRTGLGPILRAPAHDADAYRRALERACRTGDAVRLAPGTFVLTHEWCALAPWDRYTLAAVAVHRSRREGVVFTGLTAAHLHGMSVAWLPEDLEVRPGARGHRGRRPGVAVVGNGRVPQPPGLRCRTRGGWACPDGPQVITARLKDGTDLGPVRVDAWAAVLQCVAAVERLPHALPVLDSAAAAHPDRYAAALALGRLAPTAAARARQHRAFTMVEPGSESAGESASRGILLDAGFARPEVQREFRDGTGAVFARTDFWWEEARLAGEFDGVTKYDVALHESESARVAAIRAEKDRELALERQVAGLVRWSWTDLTTPGRLARVLSARGVPRSDGRPAV